MPARTLPNLGLQGFFDLGEDGWKDEMDLNLLKLSVLTQGGVVAKVGIEPEGAADGDVYLLDETADTNANAIAIRDAGAWVYVAPSEGWLLYNREADYHERFTGAAWEELVTGSGGGGGSAPVAASWSLQWGPLVNEPPAANFATLDTRNSRPVLDFDAAVQEAAVFGGVLPHSYAGAGLTVTIYCALSSAVSGTLGWDVAIERAHAGTDNIGADSFAPAQVVAATAVPATAGIVMQMSVNIAHGANMDNLAAGDLFRIRIRRDAANDTAAGDAELLRVVMREQ